jgi:hypothetical protein
MIGPHDALDRLVDWASWRIDRPSVELTAATVREALERLREERDDAVLRWYEGDPPGLERAEAAEAEVRQLREERDAADSQVEHFKRLWVTVEAWVRQLREDTRRLTEGQNMADPSEFIRNQELAAERAMRRSSGEGYAYEQGRRDAFFEVRDHMERRARAALPAREKGA